jgi:hypothetical protein
MSEGMDIFMWQNRLLLNSISLHTTIFNCALVIERDFTKQPEGNDNKLSSI